MAFTDTLKISFVLMFRWAWLSIEIVALWISEEGDY